MIEKVVQADFCCLAGKTAFPDDCPFHPPAPVVLGPDQTVTVCPRCDGSGYRRLRGAEKVREAMGWPRETPDLPCPDCRGKSVVIIDQAVLDERRKAQQEREQSRHRVSSVRRSPILDGPVIRLPKDFS